MTSSAAMRETFSMHANVDPSQVVDLHSKKRIREMPDQNSSSHVKFIHSGTHPPYSLFQVQSPNQNAKALNPLIRHECIFPLDVGKRYNGDLKDFIHRIETATTDHKGDIIPDQETLSRVS